MEPLDAPLARWVREPPLALPPDAPLGDALHAMAARRVGSVLVVDAAGTALGILTRHDLLGRVLLPGMALHVPLAQVMSWPVHTLDRGASAQDAVLLMAREGLRHVPITDGGRVVGIVSERDLFALQRLSLRHIGDAIDAAAGLPALQQAAADIRRHGAQLLAQGLAPAALTALHSGLVDRLTRRLVALEAAAAGLDLGRACWLAFGSEGREEQTVVTDQDNGLVLADDLPPEAHARWRAFGAAVNAGLDACGIPLCRGGVMAGQAACCLSQHAWRERFAHWIDHGTPQDVLAATIFFDLRPVAGATALALPLRRFVQERAAAAPRFIRQLAAHALAQRPPLAWHGGVAGELDLKLQGTAIFVEAARVLALATGVAATGTAARLEQAGAALGVPATERETWVAAFQHLQRLRLAAQAAGHGNHCDVAALNMLDRRMLRETLHVAQGLQQRVALDWAR